MIQSIGGGLSSATTDFQISRLPAASAPASPTGTSDFAATLANVVSSAAETLRAGEAAGIAGIQGQLSPQRVIEQVLEAERTLQAAVAIRDKLVGAYLEINRMQI